MAQSSPGSGQHHAEGGTLRGVVLITLTGVVLGLFYNYLGLQAQSPWGVRWITDPGKYELETLDLASTPAAATTQVSDDPMAPVAAADGVPAIPDLDRPVFIQLAAVKRLHDAGAALIVDAREPWEFAEGRIAGAVNLPFDEVITDSARLENLDTGGRAIVVYCGGGSCELSLNLGWELVRTGHRKVVVFQGGYPEWVAAGYPVESGQGEGV